MGKQDEAGEALADALMARLGHKLHADGFSLHRLGKAKTLCLRWSLYRLVSEEVEKEREACVRCIPTNWLDPLLTGEKPTVHKSDCREIEALLRGIQDRIRARSAAKKGE